MIDIEHISCRVCCQSVAGNNGTDNATEFEVINEVTVDDNVIIDVTDNSCAVPSVITNCLQSSLPETSAVLTVTTAVPKVDSAEQQLTITVPNVITSVQNVFTVIPQVATTVPNVVSIALQVAAAVPNATTALPSDSTAVPQVNDSYSVDSLNADETFPAIPSSSLQTKTSDHGIITIML